MSFFFCLRIIDGPILASYCFFGYPWIEMIRLISENILEKSHVKVGDSINFSQSGFLQVCIALLFIHIVNLQLKHQT